MTSDMQGASMFNPFMRPWLLLTGVILIAAGLMAWVSYREPLPTLIPLQALTLPPVTAAAAGPADRPDAVSEMEWQVLQAVAAQHADPAAEQARLIANLAFSKRRAAWEALTGPEEVVPRRQLAVALLAEIPDRVHGQALDIAQAKALQQQVLADLEPDAAVRAQRVEAEARRLPRLLAESGGDSSGWPAMPKK